MFEGLPQPDLQRIMSNAIQKTFAPGQKIFRVGEPQQMVYLLLEGFAKVSQVDGDGNEVILWVSASGQNIGPLRFGDKSLHDSTARAIRSCRVALWSASVFETILDRYPMLLLNIERIMVRQTSEMYDRICEISTAPTWLCLGRTLIRLTQLIGKGANRQYELDLTQECLAQMAATTVYNVNHQLSDWERQGLVETRRSLLVIRDLAGLESLCQDASRQLTA
jgi:CRP-like cAMP-binding protein